MNTARRRIVKGVATAVGVAGLAATGVAGPAFAATQSVTEACDKVIIDLSGYSTVAAQPATTVPGALIAEAAPLIPAIYGEPELISPATDAVAAVSEYRYVQIHPLTGEPTGKEHWFTGAGPAEPSVWEPTGESRILTPAIPAQDPVYGEAPLITAEVPAQDAVYADDEIVPAVPGDATPNSLTLAVDGVTELDAEFGADYAASWTIDGTKGHTYSVAISGYGMEDVAPIFGETEACKVTPPPVVVVPPVVVPPVVVPPVVVPPVVVPPVVVLPVVVKPATATPVTTAPVAATPVASIRMLPHTGMASGSVPAAVLAAAMVLAGSLLTLRRRRV
ncbi:MAG: LPXTG cell wall anchor domain-containing protein [Ramlibacter sp.]|nr:LPXTG cell wall anchor domain-containing protein [Cryobacterium sp.]